VSGARGASCLAIALRSFAAVGAVLAALPLGAQRAPALRFAPVSTVSVSPRLQRFTAFPPVALAPAQDSSGGGARFAESLLAAAAGSGLGLVAGWFGGAKLGIGSGDDPNLEGAVLGAAFGSAAGAGLGAALVQHAHGINRPLPLLVGAGLAGICGGVAAVYFSGARENRAFVAFAVGQGAVTAAVAGLPWQ
jgi:hypothetical protein